MIREKIIPICNKQFTKQGKMLREEENSQEEQPPPPVVGEPEENNPPTTEQPIDDNNQNEQITPIPNVTPNFEFHSGAPYPQIEGAYQSAYEVKILKFLAASRHSEMTAINSYLYQYFVLQDDYLEIADAMRSISMVEMHHFELLSEAIVDFGGNPNLTDGRGNVWTGRNILTLRDPREILLANIKSEERAICQYQRAIEQTRNQSLKDLFARIIEDEQAHIIVNSELLKTLN